MKYICELSIFSILTCLFWTNCLLFPPDFQKIISPGGNLEEGYEARGRIGSAAYLVDGTEALTFNFGSILAPNVAGIKPQNLYRRGDIDRCVRTIFLYGPLLNNILKHKKSEDENKENGGKTRISLTGGMLAGGLCQVEPYSERSESAYP